MKRKLFFIVATIMLIVVLSTCLVACTEVNDNKWQKQLSEDNLSSLDNFVIYDFRGGLHKRTVVYKDTIMVSTFASTTFDDPSTYLTSYSQIKKDGIYSYLTAGSMLEQGYINHRRTFISKDRWYEYSAVEKLNLKEYITSRAYTVDVGTGMYNAVGIGCMYAVISLSLNGIGTWGHELSEGGIIGNFDKFVYDAQEECYYYLRPNTEVKEFKIFFKNNKLYKFEQYSSRGLVYQLIVGEAKRIKIPNEDWGELQVV